MRSQAGIGPQIPKDTGCSYAPACLECHLPKCRYDDPMQATRERTRLRIAQIQKKTGATERAIYRHLQGPAE